ncbi:MAG: hypothetical protein IJJ28_03755, partial [Lentisphaeria bacterium]|nr:hypothetical protein [Lentisphaeria bacterium]
QQYRHALRLPRRGAGRRRQPARLRRFRRSRREKPLRHAKNAPPLAAEEKTEYIAVYSTDSREWRLRRDGTLEKRGGGVFAGNWRAEYRDAGRSIRYRRGDAGYGYTLDISVNKLWHK